MAGAGSVVLACALVVPPPASATAGPAREQNASAAATCQAPTAVSIHPSPSQQVSFDHNSLLIGGKRVFIWAGEFDYWLTPSPSLWCDRFQKMRAEGYNAVSVYFNWDYQSPAPGVYDSFTGVSDIGLFLRMAKNAGLYVIARPGPYLNAAADGGGLPAWVGSLSGKSRTSASDYTAAYMDWLSKVDPVIAANQITRSGSVILYQVENEYDFNTDPAYMQDIEAKAAADGITVPTYTNDCCSTGDFASGPGAPDMYAIDNYPQGFSCTNPNVWKQVPQWFAKQEQVAPQDPKFMAELQGGFGDRWASPPDGQCQYARTNGRFVNIFDEAVLGQGATLVDTYLGVGGIQRGWTADANAPTLADQGAGINTTGELTEKAQAQKLLGYMVASVPALTQTQPLATPAPTDPGVTEEALTNAGTGTSFYALRPSSTNSTADLSTHIAVDTPAGDYPSVPQQPGTAIELNGREARFLIADHNLGPATLVYSTSELLTNQSIGGRDVSVLYGPAGEDGETVLRYATQPQVTVLSGSVTSSWDAAKGDVRLNYVHEGLAQVLISQPGHEPLLLLLADRTTAESFWLVTTPAGPALAWGPYLVRAAGTVEPTTGGAAALALTGEADQAGPLDVIAPPAARALSWNGRRLTAEQLPDGALQAEVPGPEPVSPAVQLTGTPAPASGPGSVTLPALTGWQFQYESSETQPGFSDSSWTLADHTTTTNPTKPATLPVLYADDYGYHYGDTWYRGHFTAAGNETGIKLDGETGNAAAGAYSVWLNGAFLGTWANGTRTFSFPPGTVRAGADNVIAVLAENMGHNQDSNVNDANKAPRGLAAATLQGASTPVTWRIRGGDATADPVRGPLNSDGLYGARHGWSLPGYPDGSWQPVNLPDAWTARSLPGAGVGWYRTAFSLHLPRSQDTPIGLAFDTSDTRDYRALVYLNGWLIGRYDNTVGPESNFYLPAGILKPEGSNALAIAAWGTSVTSGGLGQVRLVSYGTHTGGVPDSPVASPAYHGPAQDPAVAPALGLDSSSGSEPVTAAQTVTVTATFTNAGGDALHDVTASFSAPAGWSASAAAPTQAATVLPGRSARFTWSVTAPSGQDPGPVTFTAQAGYRHAADPSSDDFTEAALPIGASPSAFQDCYTAGSRLCTADSEGNLTNSVACVPGQYSPNLPTAQVINRCNGRVWLHELPYPDYTTNTGWAYCVSPGAAVDIPAANQQPQNMQITTNTSAC